MQPYAQSHHYSAASAGVDERSAFIMKTYLHLVGAVFAFLALEAAIFASGFAETLFVAARGMWFLFLGGFMLVSYVADKWARSSTSLPMQYAGLVLSTAAWAVMFAPMLVGVLYSVLEQGRDPSAVLTQAGVITVVIFGGLTGVVFITRRDFSFLRGILMVGSFAALILIGASLIFGFSLGLIFCWAMVVLAAGSILYDTSNVLHYYRTDQHVAAATTLFASFALLLWYVVQIVSSRD